MPYAWRVPIPTLRGVSVDDSAVGVFGRVTALNQILSEGDRVEIYRSLAADPKSARRERGQTGA